MKCTTSKLLTCRVTNGGPIRSACYVVSQSKNKATLKRRRPYRLPFFCHHYCDVTSDTCHGSTISSADCLWKLNHAQEVGQLYQSSDVSFRRRGLLHWSNGWCVYVILHVVDCRWFPDVFWSQGLRDGLCQPAVCSVHDVLCVCYWRRLLPGDGNLCRGWPEGSCSGHSGYYCYPLVVIHSPDTLLCDLVAVNQCCTAFMSRGPH